MTFKVCALAALLYGAASAQINIPSVINVLTDPSGTCASPGVPLQYNTQLNHLSACTGPSPSGPYSWALVSGGGGSGTAPYTFSLSSQGTGTLVVTHNLGLSAGTVPWVQCSDGLSYPANALGGTANTLYISNIDETSANAMTLTFAGSGTYSGKCQASTGSQGPTGATGATGATGTNGTNGASNVVSAIPNDGATGTTNAFLAKINASGNYVKATTSDTAIPLVCVVSGGGTTGNPTVAVAGLATCTVEAAAGVTTGHFLVESSTTNGALHDAGATAPTSGWVIGVAQATAAANATVQMILTPGYNAASGSGCSAAGTQGVVQAASGTGNGCQTTSATDNGTTFAVTEAIDNHTATSAAKMPVIAGASASADGAYAYDSTNLFTHVRTSGADSYANATLVSSAFTESQTCTTSSAASKTWTATVTMPANAMTQLTDVVEVIMGLQGVGTGTEPLNLLNLLIDGSAAFTPSGAPVGNAINGSFIEQQWRLWPTVVSAGANSTLAITFSSGFEASIGTNSGTTRVINGNGALTSFNLGTTHTIGLQLQCTSATGTGGFELLWVKLVRR